MGLPEILGDLVLATLTILLLYWILYSGPKPNQPNNAPHEQENSQLVPGVDQPGPQPAPKPACLRISGIPHHWDSERLKNELQTLDPHFDHMAAEVSGPYRDSCGSTQTALLILNECTSYFTFEPSQERHKVIRENGWEDRLVLDKRFYDLTPLNRAEVPIKIELVNLQKSVPQLLTCVCTV